MLLHKMQKSASLEEVILARRLQEHHENKAAAVQLPAESLVRSMSTAAMGSRAGRKRPRRAPSAALRDSIAGYSMMSSSTLRPLSGVSPPQSAAGDHYSQGRLCCATAALSICNCLIAYCLCLVLSCHDAGGYHSNERHGPTAESARIVRLLTDKCNALALRLQQVEQELSAAHKSGLIPVPTTAAAADNDDVSYNNNVTLCY
jgi:hypothetical protein